MILFENLKNTFYLSDPWETGFMVSALHLEGMILLNLYSFSFLGRSWEIVGFCTWSPAKCDVWEKNNLKVICSFYHHGHVLKGGRPARGCCTVCSAILWFGQIGMSGSLYCPKGQVEQFSG